MDTNRVIMLAASNPKIQELVTDQDILEWLEMMSCASDGKEKRYCFTDTEILIHDGYNPPEVQNGLILADISFYSKRVLRIVKRTDIPDKIEWLFDDIHFVDRAIHYVKYQTICVLMSDDLWQEARQWPFL